MEMLKNLAAGATVKSYKLHNKLKGYTHNNSVLGLYENLLISIILFIRRK